MTNNTQNNNSSFFIYSTIFNFKTIETEIEQLKTQANSVMEEKNNART